MKKALLNQYKYIIVATLFVLGIPWLLSIMSEIPQETAWILGIFAGSLFLWLTMDIGWPSILCLALLGMLPSVGLSKIFTLSFGNATFAFLMFTFICTYALAQTSLIQNIATYMLTRGLAKRGAWSFVIAFMLTVYGIGLFVSPTVLFVVLLPIFEEICLLLNLNKGHRTAQFLAITLIFMIALSAGATPISHVFAIMAMGFYKTTFNLSISYGAYMATAIPVTLLLLLIWFLTAKWIYRPDLSMIDMRQLAHLREEVKPMTQRDKWIVAIFAAIVVLWLAPDLLKGILPTLATSLTTLGIAFPPMIGTVALALISIEGAPLVNFTEALSKGVHWPSLLMAAATLALGSVFTMEGIGITGMLGDILIPVTNLLTPMLLIIFFVSWAAIQTNLSSNMVTVSVVTPIAISVLQGLGNSDVNIAVVVALIGLMASLAFATPPSMPYVAITIGSGWAKGDAVLKYGLWMMLVAIGVASFIGYPLGNLWM